MNNPTLIWHVTMAVHEDRVRALQQARRDRSYTPSSLVYRKLSLSRRLMCRLQTRPARVAP